MDFILGFLSAFLLIIVFFLGAFYGIYISEKTHKDKERKEDE